MIDVPFLLLTCAMVSAQASPMQLHCPACSQATAQRFLYSKNGCAILQCAECGLGRAQASDFDPGAYYTGDYFSGGRADGYANYRGAELVLRREFANTVDFIRKYCGSGRLLDVGCAYGFFLQEARCFFDVTGIEIAEDAAAYCRQRDLPVSTGVANEGNLGHLTPGGLIVITTGDFASRYATLFGARWRLMTPPQHLWFFTRESIRRISHPLGLSIESCDHPWKIVLLSRSGVCSVCAPPAHRRSAAWGFRSTCLMPCALCCARAGDTFLPFQKPAQRCVRID